MRARVCCHCLASLRSCLFLLWCSQLRLRHAAEGQATGELLTRGGKRVDRLGVSTHKKDTKDTKRLPAALPPRTWLALIQCLGSDRDHFLTRKIPPHLPLYVLCLHGQFWCGLLTGVLMCVAASHKGAWPSSCPGSAYGGRLQAASSGDTAIKEMRCGQR